MKLDIALPKGHLQETVFSILDLAGYKPKIEGQRSYFIRCADPEIQLRIHRAQNIGPLVEEGVYDLGITGLDWIKETNIQVKELLDLGVGTVSIVAAVPQSVYLQTKPTDKNKLLDLMLKKMQSEGVQKELKHRRFYEKPSVKRKRKRREASRRRRKSGRRFYRET